MFNPLAGFSPTSETDIYFTRHSELLAPVGEGLFIGLRREDVHVVIALALACWRAKEAV